MWGNLSIKARLFASNKRRTRLDEQDEPVRQCRVGHGESREGQAERPPQADDIERELRLVAVAAERRALAQLRRERGIDDASYQKLIRELDLAELRWRG